MVSVTFAPGTFDGQNSTGAKENIARRCSQRPEKVEVGRLNSLDGKWQRWFPESAGGEHTPSVRVGRRISKKFLVPAIILVAFALLSVAKGIYTEWLWFNSLGYSSVYLTILEARVLTFFSAAAIFCVLFLGNLALATRLVPRKERRSWPWPVVSRLQALSKWSIVLGTAIISLMFGLAAQSSWEPILRFFNQQPFGVVDPVFNRDIAFYAFSLPFLRLLRGWLSGAFTITLIGTASVYLLSSSSHRIGFGQSKPALVHISLLVVTTLALFAWGYWLGIWELVFSERGAVFGAGYTDIHAQLPAQWILVATVMIVAGAVIVSLLRHRFRWLVYSLVAWATVAILAGQVFPGLMQRLQVQPNELGLETPYIEYNIQATREAFALDRVDEQSFPAEPMPSRQDIDANDLTIKNIRLWDHRPLKDTYNQIQSIRLYYDFNDIDVDRYVIDGEYRQVMLSARELSAEKLAGEAQTWVNRKLQFTHGYGIALSPVNEVSAEGGLPVLLVKDIPPVGDFTIERPEIYFGEKTDDYVIVKTDTQEFDYPMGDQNVYGYYQGTGGVGIGSLIRRVFYAWQLADFNILISGELGDESRVLYYRNIRERVQHLAPFLMLDSDPYMVLMKGGLFWIQDGYTTSDRYPYSEPLESGVNYIRNSVKVVIDAYNGSVTFYVSDAQDPLIRTYQAIFPDLFVPMEQMPESVLAHLRYPEDMFNVQASVYQSYHMRDARVFYNKEDLWAVPREVYASQEQLMEPYYVIMRLPNEEKEEFLLMLPFTPVNKNNTIGWLGARCDGDDYGTLVAYHFPKERLVYGPSQIENRIQQDTIITEQLALWGRGGSRVIRGNLLVIPLGSSNLYVEAVFLQAEAGGLPELKRVIVAAGDQIAMEPTLPQSLQAVFGSEALPTEGESKPPPSEPAGVDIAALIQEAQQHYESAQRHLRAGDWAAYGTELEALKAVLDRLGELVA
jgi:uncharacterized membrane protein (UPF0182 family)